MMLNVPNSHDKNPREKFMEDKKCKVSVVTAVYNVELYLGEMIESIIVQTIGFENARFIVDIFI